MLEIEISCHQINRVSSWADGYLNVIEKDIRPLVQQQEVVESQTLHRLSLCRSSATCEARSRTIVLVGLNVYDCVGLRASDAQQLL